MNISESRSKIASVVVVPAVAALAIAGAVSVTATLPTAQADSLVAAAPVEDEGADCPTFAGRSQPCVAPGRPVSVRMAGVGCW